jgi:two-component system nitrate/nitrite response regulator NarP
LTRILIADDHPIIVSGLAAVLADSDYEVVGSVANGLALADEIERTAPELLLLDVSMPGCGGVEALRALRARGDPRPVVLLTAGLEDRELIEAVQLGVEGIVLKEGAHNLLIPCLDAVRDGGRWIEQSLLQRALDLTIGGSLPADPFHPLTGREREIAALAAEGLRNRDIAGRLELNEGTVKVYLHRIYRKLGVATRTELAIRAQRK